MTTRSEMNKDAQQPMNAKLVNDRAYETCDHNTIRGQCFEEQDGGRYWMIYVGFYSSDKPSQAWIIDSGGSIRTARLLLTPADRYFEPVLGKTITNVDPALKHSVYEAIRKWENEPAQVRP